ncbi:hypothetical protein [Caldalkalibacillus salinus]|uniref:hypothetical protein n=1 Tax=Caldalkalibacillus salinus TaxID=2803787 RepID=UPI00192208EE|nr:hypothetical protein [Caldalkalibacillus salinus]
MTHEILLLKIHNGLKDGKDYYEATRGNWKLDKRRPQYIQYVVGINRGKVVCAFQPTKWGIVEEGTEKNRKFFDGIEAPAEVLLRFQSSTEQIIKKFGTGSPVAYTSFEEINNT